MVRLCEGQDQTEGWQEKSYHQMRVGKEDIQHVHNCLVELHSGSLVATTVTVVRSTENCDNILVMAPVVTLHIWGKTCMYNTKQQSLQTSMTSWCARAINDSPLVWLNCSEMSCPKV